MAAAALPWPPGAPPAEVVPSIADCYGPGIALFGAAVVHSLHCHAEGINGVPPPELSSIVESYGGALKWHACVAACVDQIKEQPGGLQFNWFMLGSAGGGPFGVCCLTCGSKSTGLANSGREGSSSPFHSFLSKHIKNGRRHETARDALLAQVEEAHAASGVPRAELAMRILAQRAGLLPSAELPHVELQPVGSEPIGTPTTRSAAWSSVSPDQPASKQEQLDATVGSGAYVVNDDDTLAGCQRCSRHHRRFIHLSHPNWLNNASAHYESHRTPKGGMQTLEFFGIKPCTARLCNAVATPAFEPDYSSLCHGFWLESVTYGDTTYDTDRLMDDSFMR